MGFSIGVSRLGHLIVDEDADASMSFAGEDEVDLRKEIRKGDLAVWLWLAARWPADGLPPAALWWRDWVNEFLKEFCAGGGDVEGARDWSPLLKRLPLMKGAEFVTTELLNAMWQRLADGVQAAVAVHAGCREGWLADTLPHWHLVGRVTLHLAENPRMPDRPFAFLATYTSGLNEVGEPRHLPLQQALKTFSGKKDRQGLLKLLEPLSRASEQSGLVKELVDSSAIYRPQAWSPGQAYRFLREVPVLERCGLTVRIPDWWKSASKRRPLVTVTLGREGTGGVGAGGLLSFEVALTLDGEKLTKEEMEALRTAQGLVWLKGRWVEVDSGKLKSVMEHWQRARVFQFQAGVSFLQAARMLAGAMDLGGKEESPEQSQDLQEWSVVEAEGVLEVWLKQLRQPQASLAEAGEDGDLNTVLRPYQKEGVSWLQLATKLGVGVCLADDMGLGKTVQVLAMLLRWRRHAQGTMPALLVAPASLLLNWQSEAQKFAPSLKVLVAHGSGDDIDSWRKLTKGNPEPFRKADLVLTTYGMVARLELLQKVNWSLLVLDEAQAIKNPASLQARAVKKLAAHSRIALTGTPIENRLGDLWSLFDFLNPGFLGSETSFQRWVKGMTRNGRMDYGPLRRLVGPFILRRLKTDKRVIPDLPEKIEMVSWCHLTKPQAVLYQKAVEALRATLAEVERESRTGVVLSALMTLKQICNHPAQHSGDVVYEPELSGKFIRLRDLAEQVAQQQEKLLVFTQFTQIIPALRSLLRAVFQRDGLALTGSTPVSERRELVEAFQQEDGPPFFVLSLKAGGTGLTLTAASQVVHFDRWWNPAVENQATDRAFRIGQRRNVLVHKLVCRGTLEERIDRLIDSKKSLAGEVLAEGAEQSIAEMNDDELLRLVSLDRSQMAAEWGEEAAGVTKEISQWD